MKTRSLIVRFPGAMDWRALLPECRLASLAAALREQGHTTTVLDSGVVSMFARLFPEDTREGAERVAAHLSGADGTNPLAVLGAYWRIQGIDRAFRRRLAEVCDATAASWVRQHAPDFVAFYVATTDEWLPAQLLAHRLKALHPEVPTLAWGPFIERYEPLLAEAPAAMAGPFDGFCVADPEGALPEWAERVHDPERWGASPCLLHRREGHLAATERRILSDTQGSAWPGYEPGTYLALDGSEKLHLFTLEDGRGCQGACFGCPELGMGDGFLMKPAAALRDEIVRIIAAHGARTFHVRGGGGAWDHVCAVAQSLLARGLNVAYSRAARLGPARPVAFPLLRASGCAAITFRLDTGSQRLLEDFYGRDFGVTHAEHVVRAAKAAGLFTVIRLTYPCPADDHHTTAETIRFAQRTRPHAAVVALPEILPRTAWHARTAAFGFRHDLRREMERALDARTRFPLPPHRWRELPFGVGRLSASQAIGAHEDMALALEREGLATQVDADMALAAALSGFAGREGEFAAATSRALLSGDTEMLRDFVHTFNEAASAPARVAALAAESASAVAVGN